MSTLRRVLLIALLLLLSVVPSLAQSDSAWVRFVHVIPGASAIDVYTDGQLTIRELAYGSATNFISVSAGAHSIAVTQAGGSNPLWEQDIEPSGGAALTLVASSAADAAFQIYQDDLNPLALDRARFTAVHAIGGVPTVDVLLSDGRPVIPGLQANQPYGTLDLPTNAYELVVVPAGMGVSDALVGAAPYKFNSGTSYLAIFYGTEDSPAALFLGAPARSAEAETGYARIAHTLAGAPDVDVFINETLVAPALAFGESTGYLALPVGSHTLAVRAAGEEGDLATGDLELTADGRVTALVGGDAEAPAVEVVADVVLAVNETTSIFTLINAASADTISAVSTDGTSLLGDIAPGESDSTLLEPSESGISVDVSGENAATLPLELPGGVYGGVVYTAVAVEGADGIELVQLPAASLAQGITSAAGEGALATPEPTVEPTPVPEEPTAAPTEAAAEAQPTAAPTEAVIVQPTAAATAGPTARILLDPGVNLQLRQYPNREAFSLGLAPSGSVVRVNGRPGEAVPVPGTTATPMPPEATPFVDPVTTLEEGADLDPALTWLNVTFDTPDGGSITAWVNALYLGITDAQGRAVRLRDLPTIPSNRAGTSQNTAVEPPTARRNVTFATITNLDPGVNTHLRRLPSTAGESLALLPAGTETEFLGVNEERDWVFVLYTGTENALDGWVSVEYVALQRNGLLVSFDSLQELNELAIISDDERGGLVSGSQPTAAVEQDLRNVVAGTVVGLNPDANLHLRRSDNEQAESLALLPNGTVLIVNGRGIDDLWLQVTHQGQTGWVASEYLALTFNGQPYELATLPVIDTTPPTAEATETPAA